MKKKIILMAVALGLVTTTIVGGTLAATTYQASTQAKDAKIDTKKLSISIVDETETVTARKGKNENSIVIQEAGMPGEVKSYNNVISNDGNYELYTRVTIYKTWKDAPSLKAEMITLTEGSNWIKKEIDDEQIVLYYKKPLAPREKSSSFLTGITYNGQMENEYAGKEVEIEIYAEAVQKLEVIAAMKSAWGVIPELDSQGEITTIND